MSEIDDFSGLPTEIDEQTATKWSAILVKITLAVLVIGIIIGVIFWATATGSTGQDLGALTWCITFALSVALMSIRQIILAERR